MEIKTTLTQNGALRLLAKAFKDNKEIKKLIAFDKVAPLAAEEVKKVIKEGKGLRTLRPSTKEIRRNRGHNVNTPLFASGALYDSIKAKGDRIEFNAYGRFQAEGFIPEQIPIIRNNKVAFFKNKTGIQVPPRNPFVALSGKELADKIQQEVSKNMPEMIKKIMRVGVKTKL